MIAGFITPFLATATLLLSAGPALAAQDSKEAQTAPKEVKTAPKEVQTPPKEVKPTPKKPKTPSKPPAAPIANPMLGDQNPTAPPKPKSKVTKTPKKPKKLPYEERVDLNNASKAELMKVQGITDEYATKIIAGRPYKSTAALAVDQVVPSTVYFLIKDKVAAGKVAPKKP